MLSESIIKRLVLARYFFRLADDNARSDREVAIFAAINLLQDSVEFFLLAAAEHLNADIKTNTSFDQYLDKIDAKTPTKPLPFRARLVQLNKMRVNAKHHGIRPDTGDVKKLILVVREFFEESALAIFDVGFWTISLAHLLDDGKVKGHVLAAERAFGDKNYRIVLIECRKAFYSEFEFRYNIKWFENEDNPDPLMGALYSSAPWHVKNKRYIDENVREPFDYIVLDHDLVERELTTSGIDHSSFWNVRRLTPQVFRDNYGVAAEEKWVVKNDLYVLGNDGIAERASYVLETTIDIVLAKHLYQRKLRVTPRDIDFVVKLKREEVSLYQKADRTSSVAATTPKGLWELTVTSSCDGLRGDATYWQVFHRIGDDPLDPSSVWLSGYLHEDDVETGS